MSKKKDIIFFLEGVSINSTSNFDQMCREKVLSNIVQQTEKIYDKLPVIFTCMEDHPKNINLHCWYCSRLFKGIPYFEPLSIEPYLDTSPEIILEPIVVKESKNKTKKKVNKSSCNSEIKKELIKNFPATGYVKPIDEIKTSRVKELLKQKKLCIIIKGVFCHRSCVSAWIYTYTKDVSEKFNKLNMLTLVHEIFTGESIKFIQPALSYTEMIKYGGRYSEIEWCKYNENLDRVKNKKILADQEQNYENIYQILIDTGKEF